jgi:hypothetical protein
VNLAQLTNLFAAKGVRKLYAKSLARNDNSKNQPYFGPDVATLNAFPSTQIFAENTKEGPSFKALLDFGWLLEDGRVCPAPHAKIILYSQYPEVRFSGFLRGCENPPSELMMSRDRAEKATEEIRRKLIGRVLFLGVSENRKVIGHLAAGDSEVVAEFNAGQFKSAFQVFKELPVGTQNTDDDSERILLSELRRIHHLGWINSKQLGADRQIAPCNAPQCGGYTLEAELGIAKNSSAEPDFHGWEVKQHAVSNFAKPASGRPITLMTPEPTGGFYQEQGVEAFLRKFGYKDRNGIPDRLNFGGKYCVGKPCALTEMATQLVGYDASRREITDANGAIVLLSSSGEIAAKWDFSGILAHWSRKHTQAVYVPSKRRIEPDRQYCYGNRVRLAKGTDSLKLLSAIACGTVYYDPGIKLENASTAPEVKRRSQFRIPSKHLSLVYGSMREVEV